MKTLRLTVDPRRPDKKQLAKAARVIRGGGLVAFPTETVYGLGANALSAQAIRKIFRAKGRPSDNPLIVHIAEPGDLDRLTDDIPASAKKLIRKFWPGPLTLVLKKSKNIPAEATAGLDTVAVRMPDHPVAIGLIRMAGCPVAAPSANTSGRPSPTSAGHVAEDLDGRIHAILDGGPTRIGIESTVLDLTSPVPVILRPGKISESQIRRCIGVVVTDRSTHGKAARPRSPGMKYRHYAPRARLIVVEGSKPLVERRIRLLVRRNVGRHVTVLVTNRRRRYPGAECVFVGSSAESIARNLFRLLRETDKKSVSLIVAEGIHAKGLGAAVMNRLRKAAGANIISI